MPLQELLELGMSNKLARFKVVIRTNFGELEVEGETVKELKDGLRDMGFSAEQIQALLSTKH